MVKQVKIVKVITRNFIYDIISNIQNIFGANLSAYERMIERGLKQIDDELNEKKIIMQWYRYEITQLTNGAITILYYGDRK
jgi:uncharacterized protein YbjQ (UPF0145 family)